MFYKQKINKIISIFLLVCLTFSLSNIQACSYSLYKSKNNTVLKVGIKKDVKRESLKRPSKKDFAIPVVQDELVSDIDVKNIKKIKYKQNMIEDEALAALPSNMKTRKTKYKKEIISDEKIVISNENKKFKRSDYRKQVRTETGLAVVLKPVNKITTKNKHLKIQKDGDTDNVKLPFPYVGDRVAFKVVEDVVKDNKVFIEKGSIVYAKVGEVSPRAMGGAPAEITIEGFEMYDKNGKLISLDGEIASSGYSLSFWIGLAELATTPFLVGFAVPLLRLLPGGQAVISPRKNYVVYY